MTPPRTVRPLAATALLAALVLSGCSASITEPPADSAASSAPAETTPSTPPSTPSASPEPEEVEEKDTAAANVSTVPGYDVGEFPPIPLFVLPDTSLLDQSADHFSVQADEALNDIPGVKASPAQCNEAGQVISGSNTALLYGDGSGSFTGPDGVIDNRGDGSGSFVDGSIVIQNNGDGTGSYVNGSLVIDNRGGGAGSYVGESLTIDLDGQGGGTFVDGERVIDIGSDGSGHLVEGTLVIDNNGDGSGSYVDSSLVIENNGDGTGTVNGVDIDVEPLAPVPPLGAFPPVDALRPLSYCGTTLTFEDGVLFDFDKSDIRPDAAATLSTVAAVLGSVDAAQLIVSGHTDAIGDDAYNQTLSEQRAQAVVDALSADGVALPMVAEGYGESRPVAANEINGVDNAAGRQLNRRVEIFIPTVF